MMWQGEKIGKKDTSSCSYSFAFFRYYCCSTLLGLDAGGSDGGKGGCMVREMACGGQQRRGCARRQAVVTVVWGCGMVPTRAYTLYYLTLFAPLELVTQLGTRLTCSH